MSILNFQEREALPLIPERIAVAHFAAEKLGKAAANPGFAAFEGKHLVGCMVETFTEKSFMGKPTGFIIELFPCAFSRNNRERVCQLLYKDID